MDDKIKFFKFRLHLSNFIFDFWMKLMNLTESIGRFAFNRASKIADKNASDMVKLLNDYPECLRKYLQDYIEGVEES